MPEPESLNLEMNEALSSARRGLKSDAVALGLFAAAFVLAMRGAAGGKAVFFAEEMDMVVFLVATVGIVVFSPRVAKKWRKLRSLTRMKRMVLPLEIVLRTFFRLTERDQRRIVEQLSIAERVLFSLTVLQVVEDVGLEPDVVLFLARRGFAPNFGRIVNSFKAHAAAIPRLSDTVKNDPNAVAKTRLAVLPADVLEKWREGGETGNAGLTGRGKGKRRHDTVSYDRLEQMAAEALDTYRSLAGAYFDEEIPDLEEVAAEMPQSPRLYARWGEVVAGRSLPPAVPAGTAHGGGAAAVGATMAAIFDHVGPYGSRPGGAHHPAGSTHRSRMQSQLQLQLQLQQQLAEMHRQMHSRMDAMHRRSHNEMVGLHHHAAGRHELSSSSGSSIHHHHHGPSPGSFGDGSGFGHGV